MIDTFTMYCIWPKPSAEIQCIESIYDVPDVSGIQEQEGTLQMVENPAYIRIS